MKTEHQLARTELELCAINSAYNMIRYLGYCPKQDSWKSYCKAVNDKLNDALYTAEYLAKKVKEGTL